MTIKGRRAKITDEGESIIISHALAYPRRRRTLVAEELEKKLDEKGHDVPQLEVLERKISYFRNHEVKSPLDKPWNIFTLSTHPIPPEAVPLVMAIARNKMGVTYRHKLTIREAVWIGKLYTFVPEDEREDYIVLHELLVWAESYALMERYKETSGKEPPAHDVESWDDEIYLMSRVMQEIRAVTERNVDERSKLCESISRDERMLSDETPAGMPPDVAERIKLKMEEKYRKSKEKQILRKEAQNERPHNQEVQ